MLKQFSQTTFRPSVFHALDGRHKAFPFFLFKELSGRWWDDVDNFKPGAFARFLSHAAVWSKIASSRSKYAVILEDDVTLNFTAIDRRVL